MKKFLLLITITCMSIAVYGQSDIIHKTFTAAEMTIPMNANAAIDMDEDGKIDFYANSANDQLGLTGVVLVGCFPGAPYDFSTNIREFVIFNEGELIQINDNNMFDYIEDDGTLFNAPTGMASNVTDLEDFYVGIALMDDNGNQAKNGWIKMQLDIASNELIIKEWAYTVDYQWGENAEGILAGETGAVTSVSDLVDIQNVVTSPNPASDQVNIQYDYTGEEQLTLSAYSSIGQLVYSTLLQSGEQNIRINTQDWNNGNYMLRFTTDSGVKTEQLIISK